MLYVNVNLRSFDGPTSYPMINDIVHQYWPMCANEQYRQFTATCPYILDTDIPPFL